MFRKYIFTMGMAILVVLAVGYTITSFASNRITDELIDSFEKGDIKSLQERIAWDDLRHSLAVLMKKEQELMRGKRTGFHIDEGYTVDEIVDYYVQPENIDLLFYFKNKRYAREDASAFIRDIDYAPILGFYVELGRPVKKAQAMDYYDLVTLRLYFGLDGFSYKLKEMHIPNIFLPKRTYQEPALEHFIKE